MLLCPDIFAASDKLLLHRRFTLRRARHSSAAQLVSLEIMDGTYESIYLAVFILAGPVYNNALTNRAALLCRTQRRVARMCSSNLSVNCEYVAKQTLR